MATVTGFTSARMLQIEQNCIVNGAVDLSGRLQLTTRGGTQIDAGLVKGEKGDQGEKGLPGTNGLDANYYATRLASGVSLDSIDVPGFYVQPFTASATLAMKYPAAIAGMLEVTKASDRTELYQRYTDYLSNRVWIRSRYNNVWQAWAVVSVDNGVWTPIVFGSGYKVYGAAYPCAWKKSGDYVQLKGLCSPNTGTFAAGTNFADVFILPPEARPPETGFFAGPTTTSQDNTTIVVTGSSGSAAIRTGGTAATYVSLSNIGFYTT